MRRILLPLALIIFLFSDGCYYDKLDELYPNPAVCDSAGTISYTQKVAPILHSYCTSCHSASNVNGGVLLDNYNDVHTAAQSGLLLGAMKHLQGYSPMPPNSKLDTCKIRTVEKWVQAGAPNN